MDDLGRLASNVPDLISTRDAAARGYGEEDLDQFCRSGTWTRIRRGLYLPGPAPTDPKQRYLVDIAAALRAFDRKDAAVAHISAGVVWKADWLHPPDLTDVWLACDVPGKVRSYPGLRILPAGLSDLDVVQVGDWPVSTPARTIVDLARHLGFTAAVVAADSIRRSHQVTDRELADALSRCWRWPYVRRARRVVDFSTTLSESPLESRARVAFAAAGLPAPKLQVLVRDGRGVMRRLDFLFGERTDVEPDGRMKYKDPSVLWRQKERDDGLAEVGVHVLHLTHADITGDPRELARRVRAAMARAGDA